MKKYFILQSSGFTMFEMAMVIIIFFMSGYVLFAITRTGNEQSNVRETLITLQEQGRESLYKMEQELRQSAPTRVDIDNTGTSVQFQIPDPNSFVDTSFNINWNGSHTIHYYLQNHQLLRTDETTELTAVLANNVTSISFEGNQTDPTSVKIVVGMQKQTPEGRTIPMTPVSISGASEIRNH